MNPMQAQHQDGVEETPATTTDLSPTHQQDGPSDPKQEDLDHTDEATTMNLKHAQHHDGVEKTPLGTDQENQPKNTIVLGDLDHSDEATTMNPKHAQHHDGVEKTQTATPPGADKENQPNDAIIVLGDLDHTEEATSANFDGWNNLPPDICRIVLDLLDAFDILRFPLCSGPWADAYAKKPRLQPDAPTLLTSPSDGGWEIPDDGERGLLFIHNIFPRKAFLVEVEGLRYGTWIGGKDGWLVTTGRATYIQLLNPITRCCTTLPDYLPVASSDRVQLCRTPTEADGYFAIAISFCQLSYTMEGCDQWITLENPNTYWLCFSDAIMHRGKIIAICQNGDLWSWDLVQGGKNPNLLVTSSINTKGWAQFDFILAPSVNDNVLIVSPYGEDIPIRCGPRGPCQSKHSKFFVNGALIHELDIDAQSIKEVRDIGDRALFLGPNYPFYVPVSQPFGEPKKNYLYIAAVSDHDVVAIDLSIGDLPGNVSLIDYSGLPDPYQKPMWFRPAFPDLQNEEV